jgi:hypothetical protein
MDEVLKQASEELGQSDDEPLEWSEQELVALEAACAAADRSEALGEMFASEQRNKPPMPALLVKLSAEMRALDRQVVDLLGKVNPGLEPAVSARHQKASRERWGAPRLKSVRI